MRKALYLFGLQLLLTGVLLAAEPVHLDKGTGILHGTIELPPSKPPFPAVLLIAGSGPTDRDGNSTLLQGKNDSLKMLAESLAAHGIASLRYDKRLIGESKNFRMKESDLRFDMYVDDAAAWGEYLRKDSRFCDLVIVGHSEGSLIGMLAAQKLAADGYVSIDGAGRPAGQIILQQSKATPIPAELMKQIEDIVKVLEEGRQVESVPSTLERLFRRSVQPYEISWFKYNPAQEIAKLTVPVLILQGSTDIQVSIEDAKLLAGANPAETLVVLEGMNHVLKQVPADMREQRSSYGDPSLPLHPGLKKELADWINGLKMQKCRMHTAPPPTGHND